MMKNKKKKVIEYAHKLGKESLKKIEKVEKWIESLPECDRYMIYSFIIPSIQIVIFIGAVGEHSHL